jgi:hypothetical protein
MSQTTEPSVLEQLAAVPRPELQEVLERYDPDVVVDAVARNFAARLDRKTMAKEGIVIEFVCHTTDDAASVFIVWTKDGAEVTPTYDGPRRPARMEWQRLVDAVEYELSRITLQGVGLVERFSMSATKSEIEMIYAAEDVGSHIGHLIRSVRKVQDMNDRQREKELRGIDATALLVEQQQAMNEALRIFHLLPELDGRVIEWRIGEDNPAIVQSIYRSDGWDVVVGEKVGRHALLHFFRVGDFAQFLNGKTNVPTVAMQGHLKVDGDFHLLEVLARIPEPFDPAERWAID